MTPADPTATRDPFSLAGRTILVTGASSGIGRATAIAISRQGARVLCSGRNEARLDETLHSLSGEGHRALRADLTAADELSRLAETSAPLDGLVNSAGQIRLFPARMYSEARLESLTAVNYKGPMALTAELLRRGKIVDGASIVILSSVMSVVGSEANGTYAATKGALTAIARCMALELAPRRVRVNAVSPAFVETPMLDRLGQQIDLVPFRQSHPLGFGTAEDVAWAVAFLLSDAARWITGINMILDGGYSAK